MKRLPVFVYGTLRHGQGNYRLLRNRTSEEFTARASGLALVGHGVPFAVEWETGTVVGELMHVADEQYDAVMRDLDRLEGYRADLPESSMYVRVEREIEFHEGENNWSKQTAFLYMAGRGWVDRPITEADLIRGGDWVASRHAA